MTLKTILLAQEEHEKRNDKHIYFEVWYHRYPPCPKFTECIRQKQADSADKSTQNSNSVDKKFKSASTRANKKRVANGLSQ